MEVTHSLGRRVAAEGIQVRHRHVPSPSPLLLPAGFARLSLPCPRNRSIFSFALLPQVWNPGFDVTPGSLIAGIITERGCYEAKGAYDMADFMGKHAAAAPREGLKAPAAEGKVQAVGQARPPCSCRSLLRAPPFARMRPASRRVPLSPYSLPPLTPLPAPPLTPSALLSLFCNPSA